MKPKILVVDDEAPIRNLLEFSLQRAEMVVEVVSDGAEALERLVHPNQHPPDLIVMDWMMPGLDGLQLLAEVWGEDRAVEERTVDVHIRRLRKVLECTGHQRYVQTVRGHGYRFSDVL